MVSSGANIFYFYFHRGWPLGTKQPVRNIYKFILYLFHGGSKEISSQVGQPDYQVWG